MGYGEDANAALGAAGTADQVGAAAVVGVGSGCVYDLDKGLSHVMEKKVRALRECPHLRIEIWGTRQPGLRTKYWPPRW